MYKQLREKGWSQEEIDHLQASFFLKQEHKLISLLGIFLLLLGSAVVPFVYGFLGQILPESLFQIMLVIIALPLGWMYAILLIDFDRLTHKHHVALLTSIPVVTTAAAWAVFTFINSITPAGGYTHNALIGALAYAIAFTLPYAVLVRHEWNLRIGSSNT